MSLNTPPLRCSWLPRIFHPETTAMKNPLWKTWLVTRRFDTQHDVPRGGGKKKRKKETGKRTTGDRRTPTKQQILHERERRRNMNETKKDEIIKDERRCFRRNQSMPPRKIYRCVIFRFFIISISRLSICIRFPRWTMFISLHPCDIARN